jgi:hypothetical protein
MLCFTIYLIINVKLLQDPLYFKSFTYETIPFVNSHVVFVLKLIIPLVLVP